MAVNPMDFSGKATVLDVVRTERAKFYDIVDAPENWYVQTRCAEWQVRDLVGHMIDVTEGLPSVSVPVLSRIMVSIFSMRSKATASRTSTPACAPRPTPTMIDMGVAKPKAQGHAMMRTATAATKPNANRGSGPQIDQAAKAAMAAAMTAGTNQTETLSAIR